MFLRNEGDRDRTYTIPNGFNLIPISKNQKNVFVLGHRRIPMDRISIILRWLSNILDRIIIRRYPIEDTFEFYTVIMDYIPGNW